MKGSLNVVVVFFLVIVLPCLILAEKCKKINSCSCKMDSGFVLDLKYLANKDNTPRFSDIPDTSARASSYSWNPCNSFNEGSCTNVSACMIEGGVITSYSAIGTQDSADFSFDGHSVTISYSGNDGATKVTVICDNKETGKLTKAYTDSNQNYFLELKTRFACNPGKEGISVGSILCIAFFSTVVFYLVIGILIQKFVRKESGIYIVPNLALWASVPILVKDGVLFVARRGRANKTYDSI